MVWTLDYALMTLKIKLHYDKSKIYNSYLSSEKKKHVFFCSFTHDIFHRLPRFRYYYFRLSIKRTIKNRIALVRERSISTAVKHKLI